MSTIPISEPNPGFVTFGVEDGGDVVYFEVLGKPEPAGSKKAVVPRGKRFAAVVDANPRAKRYKESVAGVARAAMDGRRPFDGPVAVRFEFVLARGASHWLKGGGLSAEGQRRRWHTSAPDALKLARAVEDGMTGVVYGDDAQIVHEWIEKRYQYAPGDLPRAIVEVRCLG